MTRSLCPELYKAVLVCLACLPLVPATAWSQDVPGAAPADDAQMETPPPVSAGAYPTEVKAETRSNYLRGGFTVITAYTDNLYPGGTMATLGETSYSFRPTITLDQTTARQHRMFSYTGGYTIYEPTTSLNETDQNADLDYEYRFTPHVSLAARDAFRKSSNAFSQSYGEGTVASSPQAVTIGLMAPFAQQLNNIATVQLNAQTSRTNMIGFSGVSTTLHYPEASEVPGLYDSNSRGGSAFFNHRLSDNQYVGINYQYSQVLAYPEKAQSDTQSHTIFAFYSIFLNKNLTISVSGGPQHYNTLITSLPASTSWSPSVMTSLNWQGVRSNFSANYAREVTAGGGLLGAYRATVLSGAARWKISSNWTTGANANYSLTRPVTQGALFATEEGHTVSGIAALDRAFGDRIKVGFEYDRSHQSYGGIPAEAINPDSNREAVTITWEFIRALGR